MSEAAMSWTDLDSGGAISLADAAGDVAETTLIMEITLSVRRVVAGFRAAGQKAEGAWYCAGEALGITARRVRSYCAGDVTNLPAVEYVNVRRRMKAWMEADIARCEARIAAMKASLAAADFKQKADR